MHAALGVVQDSQYSLAGTAKFTAAYRLLRKEGFGHVLKAERIGNDNFKIFFIRNAGVNARLGVVASKKILASSVARNRIKRIIREVFRHHSINRCTLDIVVMVKRVDSQEVDAQGESLKMLFGRVESRCEKS